MINVRLVATLLYHYTKEKRLSILRLFAIVELQADILASVELHAGVSLLMLLNPRLPAGIGFTRSELDESKDINYIIGSLPTSLDNKNHKIPIL